MSNFIGEQLKALIESITDIDTQYVRIWGLDTGIYRLTYEGTKYIYYNGETSTSSTDFDADKPIIYVNAYTGTDGTEYRLWSSITINKTRFPQIVSGYCSQDGGYCFRKTISSLVDSFTANVKNNLDYNSDNNYYALSAYQGYLLDQRLQAVEQSGGGSSASLYKHSIKISHSVTKDGTTYYFTHTVECYSTDSTQATDAYSAHAYIGDSRASALSSGYYGAGNNVWCINGSITWNGGYFKIYFGAVLNGAFVDFTTPMTEATYSDTVTQIM